MANHNLHVVVTGSDGDGFGIGRNHFIHTMRRNVDLLYVAMDNQIYGLTIGQTSLTSRKGMKTKSMPYGNVEEPINPITLALAAGATFVARGFSAEPKHLMNLIKQGLEHKVFSFIDVFSPCVTYNHDNTRVNWRRNSNARRCDANRLKRTPRHRPEQPLNRKRQGKRLAGKKSFFRSDGLI